MTLQHYYQLQFSHVIVDFEKGQRDKYHNYTFSGKTYPGMTSVLKKTRDPHKKNTLDAWRDGQGHDVADYIMNSAADIGTQTHQLLEDYLNNRPTKQRMKLLAYSHFERLKKFTHKMDNVCGLEVMLYSKRLGVGGTADCIAEYDGNLSIIDYKTKRSDQDESYLHDAFVQATGYSVMWEEMTGQKISQIAILVSSENMQLEEFVKDPSEYADELEQRVKQYYNMK